MKMPIAYEFEPKYWNSEIAYDIEQNFQFPYYTEKQKSDVHNKCFNGKFWCIKDICGIFCALLTWILVFYAEFVVTIVIDFQSSQLYKFVNLILFHVFIFLALFSHLRTMFTDPGAVPRGTATKEMIQCMTFQEGSVIFKCAKCCSIKPDRAHHCSVCQRCIRKMDHHCPWVNNCVGENNQKYFVLFTFYIALSCLHVLFMSINHFAFCIGKNWIGCSSFYSPHVTVMFLMFLLLEALLFFIFTLCMLGSQLQAIWTNQTGIEQLKKETKCFQKSKWKSLQSVFGKFSLTWFFPFSTSSTSYYKYFDSV